MPSSSKATHPPFEAAEPAPLVVESEDAFAAALLEAASTGAPISADAEILDRFGIAEHGEDLGDFALVFPDRTA